MTTGPVVTVVFAVEAQAEFLALPTSMKGRVCTVITRLAAWPNVAGAKAMKHEFQGHFRVRTGDWRIVFYFAARDRAVVIVRIGHRSTVYED